MGLTQRFDEGGTLMFMLTSRRRLLATLSLCALLALLVTTRKSFAQDYIGIYQDAEATIPCANLPSSQMTTLYVVATLQGSSLEGIAGAEFRIEVSNPTGYLFAFSASAWASAIGNPIDLTPADPADNSGTTMGFGCHAPSASGKLVLGTVSVFNVSGAATTLSVKRRSHPTHPGFPCPFVVRCDSAFSKMCAAAAPGSCHLQKPTNQADDPPIFVAALNASPLVVEKPSVVVQSLIHNNAMVISVLPKVGESPIAVDVSRTPEGIVGRVLEGGQYIRERIAGHDVMYPNVPSYTQPVALPPELTQAMPRSDAFHRFFIWLNQAHIGFDSLWAGPTSPSNELEENISFQQGARLIDCLVKCLGTDSLRVFDMHPTAWGTEWFLIHRVQPVEFETGAYKSTARRRIPGRCPRTPHGCVLDPQHHGTAVLSREQPVEQRHPRPACMQAAGRTAGEVDPNRWRILYAKDHRARRFVTRNATARAQSWNSDSRPGASGS
jgi:hypothetical protein